MVTLQWHNYLLLLNTATHRLLHVQWFCNVGGAVLSGGWVTWTPLTLCVGPGQHRSAAVLFLSFEQRRVVSYWSLYPTPQQQLLLPSLLQADRHINSAVCSYNVWFYLFTCTLFHGGVNNSYCVALNRPIAIGVNVKLSLCLTVRLMDVCNYWLTHS